MKTITKTTDMDRRIAQACESITPPRRGDEDAGLARLKDLTKPLGSLGRLEDLALLLWRIQGQLPLTIDPARIYTVAGDHGIAAQGVSPYPQEVTRQMVLNFLNNGAAINVFCDTAGLEQYVVDAGCLGEAFAPHPKLVSRRVKNGSNDFSKGPAMSRAECLACLCLGADLAQEAVSQGIRCLGTGEMGIANTTPATALFSAYLGFNPAGIVGPGTGLNTEQTAHKAEIIARSLKLHRPTVDSGDPIAVLAALGGLEIATLAGLILGAAQAQVPVVIDGFISTAAAAAALAMAPLAREYCIFSHGSAEPGHCKVLKALQVSPLLDLGLRLGEGTGAALAMFLLRISANTFNNMATFSKAGISGRSREN